jgi:hypothetical protein
MAVGRRVQFSLIRIAVAAPADVVIMVALLALVLSGAA